MISNLTIHQRFNFYPQNVIRSGRFNSYVHVDMPSDEDRKEALRYFLKDYKGEYDEEYLCEETRGCNMCGVSAVIGE